MPTKPFDDLETALTALIKSMKDPETTANIVAAITACVAKHPPRVLIIVEGGVVGNIFADAPVLVRIKDLDTLIHRAEGEDGQEAFYQDAEFYQIDGVVTPAKLEALRTEGLLDNDVKAVFCKICQKLCLRRTAHRHHNGWIGDECCWDPRLRASE